MIEGGGAVIRAAFLYPWFPETWTAGGAPVHGEPSMGKYASNLGTFQMQIHLMKYARIGAAICSWWGPTSPYDARVSDLLKAAEGTNFKVGIYYEQEGFGNPSASQLAADLSYLKKYFVHPNFWRIDRKPVVFSYGDASDTAGYAQRWAQAATGIYYNLKVFPGFQTVSPQPSGWHQYSPDQGYVDVALPWTVSVSPGFWFAPDATARLVRDPVRFEADVKRMVVAKPQIQLVTTFNEWGEGTAVEPEVSRGFTELEIMRRNP